MRKMFNHILEPFLTNVCGNTVITSELLISNDKLYRIWEKNVHLVNNIPTTSLYNLPF